MKTILKITASLIVNFLVFNLCYCQQSKPKKVNNKPNVHVSNVQSSNQTDSKMVEVKASVNEKPKNGEEKEELSLADFVLSNKEDIGIVYQAYNRIRLSSNPDSINSNLRTEIEKIKSEIARNKIDYSKVIYTEKGSLDNSRSISIVNSDLK